MASSSYTKTSNAAAVEKHSRRGFLDGYCALLEGSLTLIIE